MTGVFERLDAIEARAANCRTYNFGMRAADKLAHEDVWDLLDLARKQQAALDRAESLAKYLDGLADGDKHYAKLIRAAITKEGGA